MSRFIWNLLSGLFEPRCPTCPGDCSVVPSDGPSHIDRCPYVFIGEAPGRDEDSYSRPFIGRAGREFNEALLPLAGFDRSQIYLTNTRKCRPPNNRKPSRNEVISCGTHFLPYELELTKPELIVLMGGTACSLLELDPRNEPIDLEVHHGRARQAYLFDNLYWIFPTYHPALGLHDSNKIRHIRQDFIDLRRYIDDGFTGPTDQYTGTESYYLLGMDDSAPDYLRHCLQLAQRTRARKATGATITIATDTESVLNKFWSWQVSIEHGKSIMGFATDRESVKAYLELLSLSDKIVMHHAKHDHSELLKEGISIPWCKIEDTMSMAYRLGESQGLKALAGRHCGMKMKAYMDVVKPHSRIHVLEWLDSILLELPSIEQHYLTAKKKEPRTKRVKNPLLTKIGALMRNIADKPTFDPWDSWSTFCDNTFSEADGNRIKGRKTFEPEKAGILAHWINWVQTKYGTMPTVGLDKVPIAEAKYYACRDSDANLRVYDALDIMEREFGKQVTRNNWDKINHAT